MRLKQFFPLINNYFPSISLLKAQSPLSLLKFYHHANQPITYLNPTQRPTYPFLYLLDSCTEPLSVKKIHGLLIVHGLLTRNLTFQTKLLSTYGSLGKINYARNLFDKIPDPDLYSCKAMLKCYLMNGSYADAIGFYGYMRECNAEYDNVVFSLVLRACINSNDLHEGRKLHCHVTKVGNPDVFLLNVFVDMYAKCGDLESCIGLFGDIPDGNVVSWTSVMTGCNQNGRPEDGLKLFNKMRLSSVVPGEFTMGSLLTSCSMVGALHQGRWIHGLVLKIGFCVNLATLLLDMYVKCGEISDARVFFDELNNVDLVSWTAMIVGYTQNGCPIKALKLFCDAKWASLLPNAVTVSNALSACRKLSMLGLGRSIQVLAFKLSLDKVDEVRNSLIDMYLKCGAISEANCVFERILHKDVVTWNAMISGYSHIDLGRRALELFNQMRSDDCLPDAVTVVSALSACASLGTLSIGSSFHCYSMKRKFLYNVYVSTALLDLYNKCGDSSSARRVFDDMRNRNTVTWSAMLGGYGMQGDPSGSLDLFRKMLEEETKPNDVTFTSILSACSHAGMVDEGQKYFESMTQNHNIVHSTKHYVCMVDMLARAGRLEDALKFIEGMPVRAGVGVWGALLNGCRLHSMSEIGKVAIRRMVELEPETPDYYVLISNMYAADGKWAEAKEVRELMKRKGMLKSPGASILSMNSGFDHSALNA